MATKSLLEIIRGDDVTLTVTFRDEDGTAVDLTGSTVFFTVKLNQSDTDDNAKIKKSVTSHSDPTNGETQISLSTTDTNLAITDYYWDLQIKDSGGKITSTNYGIFRVKRDITIRTS